MKQFYKQTFQNVLKDNYEGVSGEIWCNRNLAALSEYLLTVASVVLPCLFNEFYTRPRRILILAYLHDKEAIICPLQISCINIDKNSSFVVFE